MTNTQDKLFRDMQAFAYVLLEKNGGSVCMTEREWLEASGKQFNITRLCPVGGENLLALANVHKVNSTG